MKIIEGL